MYKIKFDTGEVVSFQNQPTDKDIEDVVKKLGIKPKSTSVPKDSIQPKQGIVEKVAKTLVPKSIEGLGETIGGALVSKSKDVLAAQASQTALDDMNVKLGEAIISGKKQGKDTSRLEQLYKENTGQVFNLGEIIPATQKTTKQIAGEALGTLGTVALGAKPSSNILGRLGMATAFGAGAGTQKGLEQDKQAMGIVKDTFKGATTGLATGLFFEGIFKGIKKVAPLLGKNTYNKELQPDTNELAVAIKRNADTFGEKVRNVVDVKGKPVYAGTYNTMLSQAKNEVSSNGLKLENLLKTEDLNTPIKVSRNEIVGDLISKLKDQYGALTQNQIKTIEMFVKKLPTEMDRTGMLKNKRLIDGLISKTDWNKIMLGDTQASFAGEVKYILRDNLKKAIENSTENEVVKNLNNRMALGMEVRDLTARQIAQRAKMKVTAQGMNPISRIISRIWDDVLFNPVVTTKASQISKNLGNIQPGLGTQATTFGLTKLLQ